MQRDEDDDALHIRVIDNGVGVNEQFDISRATGLGLSIVRTLVTTELGGTIEMRPAGAQDRKDAAFDDGNSIAGTVVDLRIPTEASH
jgi:two-component sensor histidine kinase